MFDERCETIRNFGPLIRCLPRKTLIFNLPLNVIVDGVDQFMQCLSRYATFPGLSIYLIFGGRRDGRESPGVQQDQKTEVTP
jgi:hypothetical protein